MHTLDAEAMQNQILFSVCQVIIFLKIEHSSVKISLAVSLAQAAII